ncbi:MAG: hypothetical protein ACK4PI_12915 [Tepidisphaerales bacterium]
MILGVLTGQSAIEAHARTEPDRPTPHEAEVGWASRRLAAALNVPIQENGFTENLRQLGRSASRGDVPSVDRLVELVRLWKQGVSPGAACAEWIDAVDLRASSLQDDFEQLKIGVGAVNAVLAAVTDHLRKPHGIEPEKLALLRLAVLILHAESDFLLPSGMAFFLNKKDFLDGLELTDDQRASLLAYRDELVNRSGTTGRVGNTLLDVIIEGRSRQRAPTDIEQTKLIQLLDEVRQSGTVSQGDWWRLIRLCHGVLRLSGVPAEQEIDTRFARYLRQWESELPEGNVKRWLNQANTAGRDLEPVRIEDAGQLRPVAEP